MNSYGIALTQKEFLIPMEDMNWIKELKDEDLFEEKILEIPGASVNVVEDFRAYLINIDCNINKDHDNQIIQKIYNIAKEVGFDLIFKLGDIRIPLDDLKDEYRPGDLIKINTKEENIKWNYLGLGSNEKYRVLSDKWTILQYEELDDIQGLLVQYFGNKGFSQPVFIPWEAVIEIIEENNSDGIVTTIEDINYDDIYIVNGGLYKAVGISSDKKVIDFQNIIAGIYNVYRSKKSYKPSRIYVNNDELQERVQIYTLRERTGF